MVALDGTLDNRDDLARVLSNHLEHEHREDPLHLILAAYRRWGTDLPRYLIGEFAFVLWDEEERLLLAARDPFGVRSLFYTLTHESVLLGSQLRQVLDPEHMSLDALDDEYLADFLASRSPCGERTAFQRVMRLRASHTLLISRGRVRTFRYWDLEDRDGRSVLDEAVYLEEFRRVFRDAVSRHLETPGKVWAELSGGLDSSSIVSMAKTLSVESGRTSSTFETLTFTWPESPHSDEREWAEEVLLKHRVRGHFLSGDGLFFSGAIEEARYRDDPHFGLLFHPLLSSEASYLKAAGVDALLSGAGAESVVLQEGQKPFHLADFLKELRIRTFLESLWDWQSHLRAPLLSVLQAYVWRPLLYPHHLAQSWDKQVRIDSWIAHNFARRTHLQTRATRNPAFRRFKKPSAQIQYYLLRRSDQPAELGSLGWSVEVRFPFLYRPLVEVAFAVPWEVKIGPRRDKRLLRDGLEGILPKRICARRTWKSPTFAAFWTLSQRWSEIAPLAERSHLVDLGIFDQNCWEEALNRARHGATDSFAALTSAMALEFWLRSFFGEPAPGMRRVRSRG